MLNSRVSGPEVAPGGSAILFGGSGPERKPVEPVDESANIRKLLDALFDARQDAKTQTERDLRDKLNALRQALGDEKFKAILEKLIASDEITAAFREFLRLLLKQWFPEAVVDPFEPVPSPSPRGGGGGSYPRADRNNFPPGEVMSNKPLTVGARYFNYTPDNSSPGKKPDNIWSGFSQGPDGNCVTVSAIKAAMMRFGQKPTDVFQSVKEQGDGYDVKMRDGFALHISRDELKQAAAQARFKGDDPAMLTDANFMYAASAKRAQMENNDGTAGRSYSAALRSLNDGEHSREGLDRLGLKNHYRAGSRADLANGMLGTVEYGGHSMAVIGGRVELWGKRGGAPQEGTVTVLV